MEIIQTFLKHPLFITPVLIVGGFCLAWCVTKYLAVTQNAIQASMVLLPGIVYLILTGAITNFSGLGFETKFRNQSQRPIATLLKTKDLANTDKIIIKDKLADNPDFARDAAFYGCRPYLIIKPETVPDQDVAISQKRLKALQVAGAIRSSVACGELRALVFLTRDNRVVKFFEPHMFYDLLPISIVSFDEETPPETFKALQQTEFAGIFFNPDYVTHLHARKLFINENRSLIAGLQEFQDSNSDVALITDDAGSFRGIVTRRQITEALTLAIIDAASTDK